MASKEAVREFWEASACGEAAYARGDSEDSRFDAQESARYRLEPFIIGFANFDEGLNSTVLEIGVGMGADHERWASSRPRRLCGIDLTQHAIDLTRDRLALRGLQSELQVADAEDLPFPDHTFGHVYSWGVLHHSPDTQRAFKEVARVLRPGGIARVMIYHKWSFVGLLLWLRYGRLSRSLAEVYAEHLESPGTKAFSVEETRQMLARAGLIPLKIRIELSPGDLLTGGAGQRHEGAALRFVKSIWPRTLIRAFGRRLGLYMMIEATKPAPR
jgi:ubiquinone/menaquinone biosynthesis C-methylase UbiE